MAKLLRFKELDVVKDSEPPLVVYRGINTNSVGRKSKLTMSHAMSPPGGRNQRHYHINADAYHYMLKGRLKIFIGPDHDKEELIAEEGDFVFIPKGVIHGLMNMSDTEDAEWIAGQAAGTFEDLGTVFVESRWDE